MYKTEFNITIGDFNIIERSGKVSHLVRFPFLVKLSYPKIFKLIQRCEELINNNNLNDAVEDLESKTERYLSLLEFEALYLICQTHLVSGVNLKVLLNGIRLTRRSRRKLKFKSSESLKEALKRIESKWGKIETEKDLINFKKFVERKRDKFNEMFPEKKASGEKYYLLDAAMSYVNYMGGDTTKVSEMKFQDYISLKKQADERIEKERLKETA